MINRMQNKNLCLNNMCL